MADGTGIEWTDATWNVVNGCSVVSPGCTNCYAMKQAHRTDVRRGLTHKTRGGMVWTGQVRFHEPFLALPLRWRRPRRIFVCAHGDLFHDAVPDDWIDQVFAAMALAPQHQFQVLTKRPDRMRDWVLADRRDEMNMHAGTMMHWDKMPSADWPLPNVWLGTSVEDQVRANERIPALLDTPAAVRWLSCEPLLGPVDLTRLQPAGCTWLNALTGHKHAGPSIWRDSAGIDWVVAGGESGPGARPMHPDWARSLRDQCAGAGVSFLFKQWGDWGDGSLLADGSRLWTTFCDPALTDHDQRIIAWPDGTLGYGDQADHGGRGTALTRMGKKVAGRQLDGQTHDGFPDLLATPTAGEGGDQ